MEISGLTPRQSELADRLWACETAEQVHAFFDGLPRSLLHDALVVYYMMVWAYMDEEPVGDCVEAREVIDRIRSLP